MTKFINLSSNRFSKPRRSWAGVQFNSRIFGITITVFCVIALVGYLIEVNNMATKGYQIKELENRVAELKQEKADLDLQALSLQSVGNVKDKVESLGMVTASEAEFLPENAQVAMVR
jgi:cell division protein FtsL